MLSTLQVHLMEQGLSTAILTLPMQPKTSWLADWVMWDSVQVIITIDGSHFGSLLLFCLHYPLVEAANAQSKWGKHRWK